ncbi:MAG: NAD(P)H-dependent oxidoreductase, partial [Deltaproteobacteria bacterium]|nr:NAD(P)H-dependent oxidoreductase [Deltaproteobacteria bacterium]
CLWDGKDGDTMAELRKKIADADCLVLATPVYVDGMTGLMKNMFDRCIPNVMPFMELDQNENVRHPIRFGKPGGKIVLISTCGFVEMDTFGPLVYHMERIALNLRGEMAGKLLRPSGMGLRIEGFFPDVREKVLAAFTKAGAELIKQGGVSPETEAEASQEFMPNMPKELFVKGGNAFWERAVKEGSLQSD